MPELIEVEAYRASLDRAIGRRVVGIEVPHPSFVRGADVDEFASVLESAQIETTSRIGKLLLASLDSGPTLGLRFGMTGRIIVDGSAPIDELEYGPARDDRSWDCLVLHLADGGEVRVNDPRRFGSVELDPDVRNLGPDATSISAGELHRGLASDRSVKSVLLDQSRIAGLGNLLVDESLWRSGIDPQRTARTLTVEDAARLRTTIRGTVRTLSRRGGSHRGDLQAHRAEGGQCPRDGATLQRRSIAGRTTYSCPVHQH